MSYDGGQLKQQIRYSFKLLISYMGFNPFEMEVHFVRLCQVFPILMVQMLFFPNLKGPWPQLQKGRKIPELKHVLFAQKNRFIETVLLSTLNVWLRNKKIISIPQSYLEACLTLCILLMYT